MARLDYRTYGHAANPPLMLIHALGTDHRFWEEPAGLLSRRYHCIAPDLQAAGGTPVPPSPVTAEEHAADLIDLADELGISRMAVAGCAIGGMIGAILAARWPERAAALVMTNPGLRNLVSVKSMLRQRASDVVEKGMAFLLPDAPDRSFHGMPHDERYDRFVERYAAQDPEGYASSVLGFLDIDIEPYLGAIRCPVLLVSGGNDILMPAEGAPEIAARLADAEVTAFEDTAHFIPFQAPENFASVTADFLSRRVVW